MGKLSDHLKSKGTTISAFAKQLDVSQSYLSEIDRGLKEPKLRLAFLIQYETGGAVSAESFLPANFHPNQPTK
jgi:transcriptional regulator with XRE-family HTH domain